MFLVCSSDSTSALLSQRDSRMKFSDMLSSVVCVFGNVCAKMSHVQPLQSAVNNIIK